MLEQADIATGAPDRDEPPFRVLPGDPSGGCVLICDHATNRMPPGYGGLGVSADQMERHIAYDIGAGAVTMRLSELLGAPAVLANFSRLLIDPNRGEDDPTLIMELSDGAVVPGNARLASDERERRLALYYAPYHAAIERTIDAAIACGRPPAVLSIHTFTESWRGRARPWHGAVLWDKDPRFAQALIAGLARDTDLVIGDNEPYNGRLRNDCMYKHGTARGLAHALVEIRQDLVREAAGQEAWAARLAGVVRELLSAPDADARLHRVEYFGSWTDEAGTSQEGHPR